MTLTDVLDRAEQLGLLADLEDPADPMTVELAGACSICGADVDPETGVCGQGHGDLDRADPAGYETDPDEPFCPDHDWPLACTGQRTPSGALIYVCPEGETWHRAGTRLYRPGAEAPETLTLTCPRHGEQPVTGCVAFTGYAGGTCYAHQLACGCTDLDESGDVAAAY